MGIGKFPKNIINISNFLLREEKISHMLVNEDKTSIARLQLYEYGKWIISFLPLKYTKNLHVSLKQHNNLSLLLFISQHESCFFAIIDCSFS